MDFIGNTFTAATLAWAVAFAFQTIGIDIAWTVACLTAMAFTALAFASLGVGALVWAARHVRIVII